MKWRPQRTRFAAAQTRREELHRAAVPGAGINYGLAVGREARRPDRPAAKGKARVRRNYGWRRPADPQKNPGRDGQNQCARENGHGPIALGWGGGDYASGHLGEPFARLAELAVKVASGVVAFRRVFGEQALDDPSEGRGNGCGQRRGIFADDRRHGFGRAAAFEGALAGGQFVQHQAERKLVGLHGEFDIPASLLGAHVRDSADGGPDVREVDGASGIFRRSGGRGGLGEAEIQNFDSAFAGDQDVIGLEVAMNHARGVRGRPSFGDLPGEVDQLAGGVGRRDGSALDELHHQVIRANVVELADVGVIERRYGVGFALEAFAEFGFGRLDGHDAVEAGVARFPHFAHSART